MKCWFVFSCVKKKKPTKETTNQNLPEINKNAAENCFTKYQTIDKI